MEVDYIGCTKRLSIGDFAVLAVFKNTVFYKELQTLFMHDHLLKILVKYPQTVKYIKRIYDEVLKT
jgi:hypothetical protein